MLSKKSALWRYCCCSEATACCVACSSMASRTSGAGSTKRRPCECAPDDGCKRCEQQHDLGCVHFERHVAGSFRCDIECQWAADPEAAQRAHVREEARHVVALHQPDLSFAAREHLEHHERQDRI